LAVLSLLAGIVIGPFAPLVFIIGLAFMLFSLIGLAATYVSTTVTMNERGVHTGVTSCARASSVSAIEYTDTEGVTGRRVVVKVDQHERILVDGSGDEVLDWVAQAVAAWLEVPVSLLDERRRWPADGVRADEAPLSTGSLPASGQTQGAEREGSS
jgi:hypothetical protein